MSFVQAAELAAQTVQERGDLMREMETERAELRTMRQSLLQRRRELDRRQQQQEEDEAEFRKHNR